MHNFQLFKATNHLPSDCLWILLPKSQFWVHMWILLSKMFPKTTFFLNSEVREESYSLMKFVNLPLLCTFLPGATKLRREILSLVENNMSTTEKTFVSVFDDIDDNELTTTLIFLI
jgi:hypothetical protein